MRKEKFKIKCPKRIQFGDPLYYEDFKDKPERLKKLVVDYKPKPEFKAGVLLTEMEYPEFPGYMARTMTVYFAPEQYLSTYLDEKMYAVLFAAGSCWEGVDFPGDIVSSLIIVKLPFAVPDPLREAEKERYATLTEYIRDIIVPDMQKKLRQGFGRAIRTESDTCVVSILDHRAVAGGRYHEDVLCALPACQMAETIEDVETFIRRQKCEEYYM